MSKLEIRAGTFGVCSNVGVNNDLFCFLQRQTEGAAHGLPGRCSSITRVISARRQNGVRASGMRAMVAVKQTSNRLIASMERQVDR